MVFSVDFEGKIRAFYTLALVKLKPLKHEKTMITLEIIIVTNYISPISIGSKMSFTTKIYTVMNMNYTFN